MQHRTFLKGCSGQTDCYARPHMQLAGTTCAICKENVLFDSDATWCAPCTTVIHKGCLTRANDICPSCQRTYEAPESLFVFSQVCPECFRPTKPATADCVA